MLLWSTFAPPRICLSTSTIYDPQLKRLQVRTDITTNARSPSTLFPHYEKDQYQPPRWTSDTSVPASPASRRPPWHTTHVHPVASCNDRRRERELAPATSRGFSLGQPRGWSRGATEPWKEQDAGEARPFPGSTPSPSLPVQHSTRMCPSQKAS